MSTMAAWWDDTIDGVPRIPVGTWAEDGIDWVTENFEGLFDWISDRIEAGVDGLADLLTTPAPLVMAAVFAVLALLVGSWKLGIGTFIGMAFIISMEQWENAMITLALIIFATLVSLVIGVPIGILAARWDRLSGVVRPAMDLLQTMPAMFWLIPAVLLFSTGPPAALVATVIFAVAPSVRLTELGIRQVDAEVVEAGHAFGATPRQILREVQLPLAMPTLMAGVNQVIMLALSMAVIAGFVGGGGLGEAVVAAITQIQPGLGFEAGMCIVILAIFLDRVTASVAEASPRRGPIGRLLSHTSARRAAASTGPVAAGAGAEASGGN